MSEKPTAYWTLTLDAHEEAALVRRHVHVDDAYSLLWDVDQKCRSYLKYEDDPSAEKAVEVIEGIREMIWKSGLMED